MTDPNLPDLAQLYPASQRALYWRDRRELAVWEAILLSLDIDPLIIEELRECTANSFPFMGEWDLALEEGPELDSIHYGRQQAQYDLRSEDLRNALDQRVLPFHSTPQGTRLIPATDFIRWAQERNWALPGWLTYHRRRSSSGQTTGPTWESAQKTRRLMELAETLLAERPTLNKAELSRQIERRLRSNPEPTVGSPSASTIRNSLFNLDNAPLKGERWEQARQRARQQQPGRSTRQN